MASVTVFSYICPRIESNRNYPLIYNSMTIDTCNFKGQKVIVRVDFNVPLDENGNITDDTRIRGALPTLKKVLAGGGALIIMSHMGRPKKNPDPKFSLKQIVAHVSELLGAPVQFCDDCMKAQAQVAAMKDGDVLLLENLRFYEEETGKPRGEFATDDEKAAAKKVVKEKQKEFTKTLASYADIYINDAFGTAHRAQASTYGVAQYADVVCAGPLMAAEIDALTKAVEEAKHPLVAIVGGSKVSTKLTILNNLAQKVDQLIVGGGIANTFLMAAGYKVGKSLAEADLLDECKKILETLKQKGATLPLPTDVVVAKEFSETAEHRTCRIEDVQDDEMILDVGPETAKALAEILQKAGTIVWNGPVGVFEMEPYSHGTEVMAEAIAKATENGAFSIAGGGDTVAAVGKFGISKRISYISTGGGAFLEFLEGKVLPAIEILEKRAQ